MLNIRFILQLLILTFFITIVLSEEQPAQIDRDNVDNKQSPMAQSTMNNQVPTSSQKTMKINTDLLVEGNINSGRVIAKKITVKGKGTIDGTLKTTEVITDKLITETAYINSLISPNGIIVIDGDVLITNEDNDDSNAALKPTNLIAESFTVNEVKQFAVAHHDDFDSEKSLIGWSNQKTNRCTENGNAFLGGHCNFSHDEVSKQFNLPEHQSLRITAGFHMFDNWNGEYGYMKIDNEIVWSREGQSNQEEGIDFCGGKANDPAFNLVIDVTIPHHNEMVTIAFGSTLEGDPCNASFGVDDVLIFIK